MVPPVAVSPLIKTARYSALIAGIIYGKQRYEYLKPLGAEDKRIAEEEKKALDEKIRIQKEIEANQETQTLQQICTENLFSTSEWTSKSSPW
ncbi:hypothetical protein PBY51_004197 [Eleginops maclovinus]|uniref:ATP synthase F(0) complex subunit e, mitochondrial n=1 Tax=Eleginops maclovinus TaxID=56733 RepID=A0AAN7Y3C6_ELEMC|nr:hypothetical protein PBY51_004197 [Eleginops maclovinus]